MFRARLAVLVLSAGLCGCVTYDTPPGGLFGCHRPPPGPCDCGAPPCNCGPPPCNCGQPPCNCGSAPVALGEGPILDGLNGATPIGPPVNGHGFSVQPMMPPLSVSPDRIRPQPLAQPMPSPP